MHSCIRITSLYTQGFQISMLSYWCSGVPRFCFCPFSLRDTRVPSSATSYRWQLAIKGYQKGKCSLKRLWSSLHIWWKITNKQSFILLLPHAGLLHLNIALSDKLIDNADKNIKPEDTSAIASHHRFSCKTFNYLQNIHGIFQHSVHHSLLLRS